MDLSYTLGSASISAHLKTDFWLPYLICPFFSSFKLKTLFISFIPWSVIACFTRMILKLPSMSIHKISTSLCVPQMKHNDGQVFHIKPMLTNNNQWINVSDNHSHIGTYTFDLSDNSSKLWKIVWLTYLGI
jgi:hypothetical protein